MRFNDGLVVLGGVFNGVGVREEGVGLGFRDYVGCKLVYMGLEI